MECIFVIILPKKIVVGEVVDPYIYFKRELNTNIYFTEHNISFTEQISISLNLHLEVKMVLGTNYLFHRTLLYCFFSNKLLGQSLNLESFDSKTKDVLCVSRFLTHINVCGNPPGRLCQPFLQFILNCKNHPNTCISSLPRPV